MAVNHADDKLFVVIVGDEKFNVSSRTLSKDQGPSSALKALSKKSDKDRFLDMNPRPVAVIFQYLRDSYVDGDLLKLTTKDQVLKAARELNLTDTMAGLERGLRWASYWEYQLSDGYSGDLSGGSRNGWEVLPEGFHGPYANDRGNHFYKSKIVMRRLVILDPVEEEAKKKAKEEEEKKKKEEEEKKKRGASNRKK